MSANPFCVVVTFKVKSERVDAFRAAVLENAQLSLREEPGCSVFDVCADASGSEIFLYEIYENREAFDDHLRMPHFLAFDAKTRDWVISKSVNTYAKISERGSRA